MNKIYKFVIFLLLTLFDFTMIFGLGINYGPPYYDSGYMAPSGDLKRLMLPALINDQHKLCSGTLINQKNVLTAAHCVVDKSFSCSFSRIMKVTVYTPISIPDYTNSFTFDTANNKQIIGPALSNKIIRVSFYDSKAFEKWSPSNNIYSSADIAILELEHEIPPSNIVDNIKFRVLDANDLIIPDSYIFGWGVTGTHTSAINPNSDTIYDITPNSGGTLRYIFNNFSLLAMASDMGNMKYDLYSTLSDLVLCHGDSGATPFTYNYNKHEATLYGILSSSLTDHPCTQHNIIQAFNKNIAKWITTTDKKWLPVDGIYLSNKRPYID